MCNNTWSLLQNGANILFVFKRGKRGKSPVPFYMYLDLDVDRLERKWFLLEMAKDKEE